jgi:serine/threonine protein kinase
VCVKAPEIYHPSHRHGVQSEAYSFGVLMYELCMGERPYSATLWPDMEVADGEDFWAAARRRQGGQSIFKGE